MTAVPNFMDPSSGVFGEEAFHQLLTREASRATRYQDFFSVCLVRPDGPMPDPDEAMRQAVARKITQFLRSTDVVAHTRDGIAILLLNTPDADAARVVDLELDCKTGKLIRRRSMDELINDSVGLVLAPFNSR